MALPRGSGKSGSEHVWVRTLADLSWVLEAREGARSGATAQGLRPSSPSSVSPGHRQAVGSFLPSSLARTGGLPQFCFHSEGLSHFLLPAIDSGRCSYSHMSGWSPMEAGGTGTRADKLRSHLSR